MSRTLEVDPEVASKIQARARERGVSVDVYLRDLIYEKQVVLISGPDCDKVRATERTLTDQSEEDRR